MFIFQGIHGEFLPSGGGTTQHWTIYLSSIYLSISLSLYLSISLSVYLSIYLSVYYLSIFLSSPSFFQSIHADRNHRKIPPWVLKKCIKLLELSPSISPAWSTQASTRMAQVTMGHELINQCKKRRHCNVDWHKEVGDRSTWYLRIFCLNGSWGDTDTVQISIEYATQSTSADLCSTWDFSSCLPLEVRARQTALR